jgi:hypothetical protein
MTADAASQRNCCSLVRFTCWTTGDSCEIRKAAAGCPFQPGKRRRNRTVPFAGSEAGLRGAFVGRGKLDVVAREERHVLQILAGPQP